MARKTNNRILKPHLILCEGRDAEEFLIAYLNSDSLQDVEFFSNEIQVMDFGGNENLENYLKLLKNMEKFSSVKSIVIIRDAERNVGSAIRQIQSALRNCEMPVPMELNTWSEGEVKIGFSLFPLCDSEAQEGTLEDLCMELLDDDNRVEVLDDIQCFMNHLSAEYGKTFPHEFKTKLHTFFSVTDKYVSLKIGEAAKAGAFNWGHQRLEHLKIFLSSMDE